MYILPPELEKKEGERKKMEKKGEKRKLDPPPFSVISMQFQMKFPVPGPHLNSENAQHMHIFVARRSILRDVWYNHGRRALQPAVRGPQLHQEPSSNRILFNLYFPAFF